MQNSVGIADVPQKLITQTLALACAFYQTGYIYNFNSGRNHILWIYQLGQHRKPLIRNGNSPNVGFYGTKREIGSLCFGTAHRVE